MVPCACLKSSKYLYQEPRWRGTKLIVANSDMMCSCQLLDPSSTGSSVSFNNSLSVCLRSVEASAWKRIAADWRQMSAHALQREECVYKTHAVFGEPVFMEFSWFGFGFHRWIWIWGKKNLRSRPSCLFREIHCPLSLAYRGNAWVWVCAAKA